jgi:hypothetical protein
MALVLSACGGGGSTPQSGMVAAPASTSVAASTPNTSTSASTSEPASESVTASEPAASLPAAASAPAIASTPVIEIDVYGDGAMSGISIDAYGMASLVSPNEPQALQSLLQAQFNDTGITIANHASGGTASSLQNMLAGVDGGGDPFAQRVTEHPGTIVIDNHGVNDALGGETLQDYTADLVAYINDSKAAGKTLVLEEPGPVCDGNHPQLASYVAAMDSVASSYNVPLIQQYNAIQSISGWCSHMTSGFYPDSYIDGIKAQNEATIIAPLVKKLIGE